MSSLQRKLGCVAKKTVGLLPVPHNTMKHSKHKPHSSSPYCFSPSSSFAALEDSSGVTDQTYLGSRGDRSRLGVDKSYSHVHQKDRRFPLTILDESQSSLGHCSSSEQASRILDFSNSVTTSVSLSRTDGCPVIKGRHSHEGNVITCRGYEQSQVVIPNLDFCFDQILCHSRQEQQQHHQELQHQQQSFGCDREEMCALCSSGLEGVCSKVFHYSKDCRCDGCLAGIKHLFSTGYIVV